MCLVAPLAGFLGIKIEELLQLAAPLSPVRGTPVGNHCLRDSMPDKTFTFATIVANESYNLPYFLKSFLKSKTHKTYIPEQLLIDSFKVEV